MTRAHIRFRVLALSSLLVGLSSTALYAQELPIVYGVEAQPLKSQAKRVALALEYLGQPLSADEQAQLDAALAESENRAAVEAIQKLFDARALAAVNINPESRVKVTAGPCPISREGPQRRWRDRAAGRFQSELGADAPALHRRTARQRRY